MQLGEKNPIIKHTSEKHILLGFCVLLQSSRKQPVDVVTREKRPLVDPHLKMPLRSRALMHVPERERERLENTAFKLRRFSFHPLIKLGIKH